MKETDIITNAIKTKFANMVGDFSHVDIDEISDEDLDDGKSMASAFISPPSKGDSKEREDTLRSNQTIKRQNNTPKLGWAPVI